MMRLLLMACAVAVLVCGCGESPDPAPAVAQAAPASVGPDTRRIHALIVGIDRYRHSDARQPGAVFSDLRGAVGDAQRVKQALAELYGVNVDVPTEGACDSSNDLTTTLTDDCATRARILKALEQRIETLSPGDTLLFYFAGHGSRYRDDEVRDQDTGYNGTIMPTDARNPDGSPGDIFDVELKALKDRATAAGLYFVSVFDSCNSATATRTGAAGLSRSAPALAVAPPPSPAPVVAGGDGYWVHLAAAQDGEEAQETGGVGTRAGVFTTALLDTLRMPGMRDATFGDLIHEVRLRVAARGHAAQTPSAEGTLTAALGARSRSAVLYDVEQDGGKVLLKAGTTGGITAGSRFALYANQADAVASREKVATASVSEVGGTTAALALDVTAGATLPVRLVAEEVAHFMPAETLAVAIDLPEGPARDAADAAVRATGFATVSSTGTTHLVVAEEDAETTALRADDGTLLTGSLGRADDPAFGNRLTEALRKIARVQQLLALRTSSATDDDSDPFKISVCIAAGRYRPTACPPLQAGGLRRIGIKEEFAVTLVNRGTRPAYVYVLAIDPLNAVYPILPKPGESDQMLMPNQDRRRSISFDVPGAYRFVTLASAKPVRADAFEQSGTRDLAACTSPLERLLCASAEGRRDVGVAAVGDWSAQVSTTLIPEKDTAP